MSSAVLVHKRPRVVIPGVDPGADVSLQGVDAGMDTPLQQLGGELGEPALNLIEPRGAGRNEVHTKPRVGGQPALDGVGLMGGVVVADKLHVEVLGDFLPAGSDRAGRAAAGGRGGSVRRGKPGHPTRQRLCPGGGAVLGGAVLRRHQQPPDKPPPACCDPRHRLCVRAMPAIYFVATSDINALRQREPVRGRSASRHP